MTRQKPNTERSFRGVWKVGRGLDLRQSRRQLRSEGNTGPVYGCRRALVLRHSRRDAFASVLEASSARAARELKGSKSDRRRRREAPTTAEALLGHAGGVAERAGARMSSLPRGAQGDESFARVRRQRCWLPRRRVPPFGKHVSTNLRIA